jgi:hypothetical protein
MMIQMVEKGVRVAVVGGRLMSLSTRSWRKEVEMEWNEEDRSVRSVRSVRREMEGDIDRREWLPRASTGTFDVANMKEIAVSEQDTAGCAEQTKLSHQGNLACTFLEPETPGLTQYSFQMAAQSASLHRLYGNTSYCLVTCINCCDRYLRINHATANPFPCQNPIRNIPLHDDTRVAGNTLENC